MVSAPASSSGKTAVTCALLTALQRRGLDPCAFKCGPDYIDPMFHRSVLGVESHNLDLFFTERAAMKNLFDQWCLGRGAAVCEGAMGLYDGVGGTDQASVWQVADALELPVLLVVRTGGAGLTLAAQIRGLQSFRENSRLRGILLNQCRPELCRHLAPMLERETGLPVLGCLPREERAEVPSRHLGLYTAGEIQDLRARIGLLADALERHVDLDRLLELFSGPDWPGDPAPPVPGHGTAIAVARDEAFCFTYAETLETLARAGARLLFFSPLRDRAIPEGSCGLYLPGGYPELHAAALAQNSAMRAQIRAAVENGMPTVAAFYIWDGLCRTLRDIRGRWPACCLGRGSPQGSWCALVMPCSQQRRRACSSARESRCRSMSFTIGTALITAELLKQKKRGQAGAGSAGLRPRRCTQGSRTCILQAARRWRSGLSPRRSDMERSGE